MVHSNNLKYRKYQKGRNKGIDTRSKVCFGDFGLKSLECARITEKQLLAIESVVKRQVKKLGKVWTRIFCDLPVSSKPVEVRMGKGKGSIDHWVARIKKGKILIELGGVSPEIAKRAFLLASSKLPIKTVMVYKEKTLTPQKNGVEQR